MTGPERRRWRLADRIAVGMLVILVSSFVISSSRPGGAAVTFVDWPSYLQNSGRTGATTDPNLTVANVPGLQMNWAVKTGGPVATSVEVAGTTAYVGSWDGSEYAIDTTTGTVIWKSPNLGITTDPGCSPVNLGITSSADVENGVVYVGGGGPYWYALDATTGAILWDVYTGDNSQQGAHYNWSSPLIYNGFAYIGVASNCDNPLVQGHLMQVSLTTHQVVNDYDFVPNGEVGGGVWTTPTLDPSTNTIFVTTGTLNDYTQTQSQAIVALNATSLSYMGSWQLPLTAAVNDSDWGTTPTLTTAADGTPLVSAANKNGILYTWKRSDLEQGAPDTSPPLWEEPIAIGGNCPQCGDGSIASGDFANGVLYYAGGNLELNGHGSGGSISALNPGTGAILWTHQTEGAIIGSPAYVNGMVAYGAGNSFQVVNASNGQLLYSSELPGPVFSAVSVARSQFYVGDIDGSVYAFGLPATPPPPPPTDPNCPTALNPAGSGAAPVCQDIGNPSVAGSESTSSGVLTVTGSGAPLSGASDQFRFISTPVTGDSQSSALIVGQSSPSTVAPQAGLMVRQTTDPTSPFYSVVVSPGANGASSLVVMDRNAWGANPTQLATVPSTATPLYVMIERSGNLLSTGVSTDGVNYTVLAGSTADLELPATVLHGLVVNSGSSQVSGTASFGNLAVGSPLTTPLAAVSPTDPCPTPWTCLDIGNPSPSGDTTSSSPTSLTLDAPGAGIGSASDSFHFVYQTVSGNESISAQVVPQPSDPASAQQGIMMRSAPTPTSPYYAVLFQPGGSATITWRYYDGVSDRTGSLALPTVTSPTYVEINRYQDTTINGPNIFFSTETSSDGISWSPVLGSTQAIPMGGSYLAGVAADAGGGQSAPPVVYNDVQIAATTAAPPGTCPDSFTCTDLGSNFLTGNQVYSPTSDVWTIRATGSDIWSTFDNFRYMSQSFPDDTANSPNGDGTISAQVVSQTNPLADGWIKTGVMIRGQNGDDPQAPYYGVFATSGNGVIVQWRPAEAALTNQIALSAGAGNSTLPPVTPVYVLAERYVDPITNIAYYAGFTSTNGTTWTWIPGSTVPLNLTGPLTAGIATDSHNSAGYSVATVGSLAQLPGSSIPPGACPSSWSCNDIGGPLPPGQDTLTSGTWSEIAGGGDIWGTADSFHLVSQSLAAQGSVSAQVTAQSDTSPWAKAGVMLRASTDPGSPYYAVFVTPGNGVQVQWRSTQGGSSNALTAPGVSGVPLYLKVTRYTFGGASPSTYYTAYSSTNGTTWTEVPGSATSLSMPGPLLAGFAITSHAQGLGSDVTLQNVTISSTQPAPPFGGCPSTWSCSDIGGPLPPSQDTLSSGTWTEVAGGTDIWGTTDSFHLVSQPLTAQGSVSAEVTAQTDTSPSAKAGVMVRATTDPGSPYYAVFVTPGNGVQVQWRSTQGGSSNALSAPGASGVPRYLRVTRYTPKGVNQPTYYTAYTSTNGTTWTEVLASSVSLSMPGKILAGFAITSHAQGIGSGVTLQNVTVSSTRPTAPFGGCPSLWTCTDIGGPLPSSQDDLTSGIWTVVAGGSDIWGTTDSFHLASRSLTAQGSVSAGITAQSDTSPWAKAGVMVRATTNPGSPYYAVFVTPGNGVQVQWRSAQGGSSNSLSPAQAMGVPLYLKVARYTPKGVNQPTYYTAYTSTNGTTWTEIPASSIPLSMPGTLLAGLAITSHAQGIGSGVMLQNVTVSSTKPSAP